MTPRPLALALTLASLSTACGGSDELECPATGAPLMSGVPELQPEWGPGCIDSQSWTATIEPANATWTVELRRDASGNRMEVRRLLDGVAVVWGSELILVGGDGNELASRGLGTNPDWTTFVVTEDGRMIISDQTAGVPEYRVMSPAGIDIWLRLLDIDGAAGGRPALTLADDGSLWLSAIRFTPDFSNFELLIQEWAVTGSLKSEVILPGVDGQAFARDGAGRFAVLGNGIELFEPDGTPISSFEIDSGYPQQIVGHDEGFVLGGVQGDLPVILRVDGQGALSWTTTLPSDYSEDYYNSYVASLAVLPDGGVVAVGAESTIDVQWPDSSITRYEQPFVIALGEDGEPTWGERLAVGGQSWSVAVGSEGEVYVGGVAQGSLPSEYGGTDEIGWLRRYDP